MHARLLQQQVHQPSSSSSQGTGIAKPNFWKRPKVDYFFLVAAVMAPFRFILRFKWKRISRFIDHELLADPVHLNETGGEIVTELVVEWLLKENVEKAIKEAASS
jgi:hypothetical protein